MRKHYVTLSPQRYARQVSVREIMLIEKLHELEGFESIVRGDDEKERGETGALEAIEKKKYNVGMELAKSLGDQTFSQVVVLSGKELAMAAIH